MANPIPGQPRRVLIVSSHPLFGRGLLNLLRQREAEDVAVVGMVETIPEALAALQTAQPDLVVVDYDDEHVNRDEFLRRYVEGGFQIRVVLLSLLEGGSQAIVYDRRTLAASQIDDWLKEWTDARAPARRAVKRAGFPQKALRRVSDMRHFIAVAITIAALAALLFFGLTQVRLLPVEASTQAAQIDQLFNLHFALIVGLFSLIVGFLVYSIVVFRRRKGDTSDGPHMEGNQALEIAWTVVPLLIVLGVSFIGADVLRKISRPDPRSLEVNVYASQWAWRFEYPDLGIISTELVLPVNKQVLLRLESSDVIHSFWVPEFRVKQDVLPGGGKMVRELRITPNREGDYKVRCAEMCGRLHTTMETPVRVMSDTNYSAWVSENSTVSDDPVERGKVIAQQYACTSCHSINGTTIVGPSWQGVYEHEVELADGSTVLADEAYLRESIIDPSAKIVAGFQDLMPKNFSETMTDEQITDVIEYIKSLK